MDATELYRAGRLQEAIAAQLLEVKAHPADQGRRLFLFELAAFAGDLDRARRQLDAVHHDQPDLDLATLGYRKLLDSEQARRRFFADGVPPEILGEATDSIHRRIEAAGLLRLGRTAEAAALLEPANDAIAPIRGTLNGKPFGALRDADDLLGDVLEVFAQGKYFWVALGQVVGLGMKAPRFPRDLLYVPARLDLEAETGEVFLPALYPHTYAQADDGLKLGRVTDFAAAADGPTLGVGSRLFLVDDDAIGLLEWREYVRDEPTPESPQTQG